MGMFVYKMFARGLVWKTFPEYKQLGVWEQEENNG